MKTPCQALTTPDRATETKTYKKSASVPIIPEAEAEIKEKIYEKY